MTAKNLARSMITLLVIVTALTICRYCYAMQADTGPETNVHHEYIDGTARIDYVEVVNGDDMITHYYKYGNPANQFLVTTVEVYSGSRYLAPHLLRIVRYEYDSKNNVTGKAVNYGTADTPAVSSPASMRDGGKKGAPEKISPAISLPTIDLVLRR